MKTPEQVQFCENIIKKKATYVNASIGRKLGGAKTRLRNRQLMLKHYEDYLKKPPTPWWVGEGKSFLIQQIQLLKGEIEQIKIEIKNLEDGK